MTLTHDDIAMIAIFVFLIFTEIFNRRERARLMDRVMAQSLTELSTVETERVRAKIPDRPVDDRVPL